MKKILLAASILASLTQPVMADVPTPVICRVFVGPGTLCSEYKQERYVYTALYNSVTLPTHSRFFCKSLQIEAQRDRMVLIGQIQGAYIGCEKRLGNSVTLLTNISAFDCVAKNFEYNTGDVSNCGRSRGELPGLPPLDKFDPKFTNDLIEQVTQENANLPAGGL